MTDGKIASLKLISGEELICTLISIDDGDIYTTLSFSNPLRIQLGDRRKNKQYTLEPWLCLKNDTVHSIDITKIITVHEITDDEVLDEYVSYYRKKLNLIPKPRRAAAGITKIGYVGNTEDFKSVLERLYKDVDSYDKPIDEKPSS